MINDALVRAFTNAARALITGAKDTGFTSNGLRKLDFKVGRDLYTAIEQNPNKLSTPAMLLKEGHKIVQIRDNAQALDERGVTKPVEGKMPALLGNVDLTENRFNSYENIPTAVDISEIEQALGDSAAKPGEVKVTGARTATPVGEQISSPATPPVQDFGEPGGKKAA